MSISGLQDNQGNYAIASVFGLPSPETETIAIAPAPAEDAADAALVHLRDLQDDNLSRSLSAKLNANPTWRNLVRQNRMSVGVVDLSDQANARYASVNGQYMMYAASLPKIAVLAAAHDAIERGELKENRCGKKRHAAHDC